MKRHSIATTRRPGRSGFTILETIIALAVASLLIIVIVNSMLSGRMMIERDLNTLDFLSKSTILLEYIKRDIRNARRKPDSVKTGGDVIEITVEDDDGNDDIIKYKYFPDRRYVARKQHDRIKRFGLDGRMGIITEFSVAPVKQDDFPGFYQVKVGFLSHYDAEKQRQLGKSADEIKPKKIHTFQALVNRRTPDSTDDRWNSAFRDQ